MTRDEVLKEFYATPSVPGGATDRMADEIVRLREENRNLAETVAAYGSYQDRLALLAETTAMIRAAIRAAEREVGNGNN